MSRTQVFTDIIIHARQSPEKCQENGWSCYNMAVEVGARGVVAESLIKAAAAIGMRGRAQKKLIRDVGMEACHCSKWLYWLCGKKEWDRRDVEM